MQLPSLDEVERELANRATILSAMRGVFARFFRPEESWKAWGAFLSALFGLQLDDAQYQTYVKLTGRSDRPSKHFREAHIIVGRRGGKSRIIAFVAVFLACFRDYRKYLAPGERATVMVIAADRKQARAIFRYILGLISAVPMLQGMVQRQSADSLDLSNMVTIEIQTASFRSTRSYTIAAALCDEIAFWRSDDSANPDKEILKAIRPGMATIPTSMLIGLSSPYARRGVLYEAYRDHYGKDGAPVLVWQADTATMNPSIDPEYIEAEFEKDPVAAMSEYGRDGEIQFRKDIEDFLALEDLDAITDRDVRERPYNERFKYYAFVDPSGGKADSMTLAIAHAEGKAVVVDAMREKPPVFSPDAVVVEFSELLKSYHVHDVTGDAYAGEWPRERFAKSGIKYHVADKHKSDLYRDFLPHVTAKTVALLDNAKCRNQFVNLERRVGRGGKESIDHLPGGHDDVCNSVAGVVDLTARSSRRSLDVAPLFASSGPMQRIG